MSKDSGVFVNRRGRRLSVDTDMTEEIAKFESNKSTQKHAPMKIPKKTRQSLPRWQKTTLIVLLIALVIAPLVLGEVVRVSYDSSAGSSKSKLNSLIELKVMSAQKADNLTAKQMLDIAADLKQLRDSTCAGGLMDNIATLYPRAKSAHDRCLAVRAGLASLTQPVQDLGEQLNYLEKIKPLIAVVGSEQSDQYAVIAAQQENWKNTADRLGQLSPPTSYRQTHDAFVEQVLNISELWTKLGQAYDARDAAAFGAGEADLAKAYEELRTYSAKFYEISAKTERLAQENYSKTR